MEFVGVGCLLDVELGSESLELLTGGRRGAGGIGTVRLEVIQKTEEWSQGCGLRGGGVEGVV